MTQKVQTLTIAHLKEKKVLLVRGKAYNIKTSNTIYYKSTFEKDDDSILVFCIEDGKKSHIRILIEDVIDIEEVKEAEAEGKDNKDFKGKERQEEKNFFMKRFMRKN